jgi:transposase
MVTGTDVLMPLPFPPEFRQRAVELARQGEMPVSKIAKDLGISDSCLRNWVHQPTPTTGRTPAS